MRPRSPGRSAEFEVARPSLDHGLFAIRGQLDGDEEAEFADVSQLIGLCVGNEEFLLAIEHVSEIIMLTEITFVPQGPAKVEGVINLRGSILPVVSLRRLMDMPVEAPTSAARIIILRHEETRVGLIVDSITYVVALSPQDLEQQSSVGRGSRAELIGGFAKRGETINGILDMAKLMLAITEGRLAPAS